MIDRQQCALKKQIKKLGYFFRIRFYLEYLEIIITNEEHYIYDRTWRRFVFSTRELVCNVWPCPIEDLGTKILANLLCELSL